MMVMIIIIGNLMTILIYAILQYRYRGTGWNIAIDGEKHSLDKSHVEITFDQNTNIVLNFQFGKWMLEKDDINEDVIEIGRDINVIDNHTICIEKISPLKQPPAGESLIASVVILIITVLFVGATFSSSLAEKNEITRTSPDAIGDKAEEADGKNNDHIDSSESQQDLNDKTSDTDSVEDKINSETAYVEDELSNKHHTIAAGIRYTLGWTENGNIRIGSTDTPAIFNTKGWSDVVSISAKGEVLIALKSDGSVNLAYSSSYTYGKDVSDWNHIIQVSAGNLFAVGLCEDGTIKRIGRNEEGQLNVDSWSDIKYIATGQRFTVGMDSKGNLFFAGQGKDEFEKEYHENEDEWKNVIALYAGGGYGANEVGHIVGLKRDGSVVCLGDAFREQGETVTNKEVSTLIRDARLVAVGDYHLVAITNEGDLIHIGETGIIRAYPNQDPKERFENWPTNEIVDIAAGQYLTIGLTKDGETYASGYEDQGQMLANQWNDIMVLD